MLIKEESNSNNVPFVPLVGQFETNVGTYSSFPAKYSTTFNLGGTYGSSTT